MGGGDDEPAENDGDVPMDGAGNDGFKSTASSSQPAPTLARSVKASVKRQKVSRADQPGGTEEVYRKILEEELRTPAVTDLEALDDEYAQAKASYLEEQREVDRRFENRCTEILRRRKDVLTSQKETEGGTATPGLPGFWKMVLQNSVHVAEFIERYDEPVLEYLEDIRWEWLNDDAREEGFKILFHFTPNNYFSNEVLEKAFHLETRNKYSDVSACVKIEASVVNWFPGKNLTVDVITKKPKIGKKRLTKGRREEVSRPSFFRSFFRKLGSDAEIPEEELDEDDDVSEDDLMNCLLQEDLEQGLALKSFLIPRAVRWYTGEACDDESDDEASDSDEDGEEDSCEEGEEEENAEEVDEEDASGSQQRVQSTATKASINKH